jgi:predicted DNA-binding transcriptional regulator AlpA
MSDAQHRRERLQDQFAYPPRLMSLERAAAYVGFGSTKFQELIELGKMPPAIDVDGSPRWDRVELDAGVENLKDRRRDPIKRSRDRLEEKLREQETH